MADTLDQVYVTFHNVLLNRDPGGRRYYGNVSFLVPRGEAEEAAAALRPFYEEAP